MQHCVTHQTVISEAELDLLRDLKGLTLDSVWSDGWSATLSVSGRLLFVVPEEVPTPSTSHPYADVDRPKFLPSDAANLSGANSPVGTQFGTISRITLFRAVVTFSPIASAPPTEILGITIPAGNEFGLYFLDSPNDAVALDSQAPLVAADLAVEIATTAGRAVTFFTRGVGHFVEVALDARLPSELDDHLRRWPLLALP